MQDNSAEKSATLPSQQFAQLFNNMPVVAFSVDHRGGISYINNTAAAICNWTRVSIALDSADIIIALDDWGTSHSSRSYLTRIRAHYVKLDRSFIENLDHSAPKNCTHLIVLPVQLTVGPGPGRATATPATHCTAFLVDSGLPPSLGVLLSAGVGILVAQQ
jgi:PAS domain-containing protein